MGGLCFVLRHSVSQSAPTSFLIRALRKLLALIVATNVTARRCKPINTLTCESSGPGNEKHSSVAKSLSSITSIFSVDRGLFFPFPQSSDQTSTTRQDSTRRSMEGRANKCSFHENSTSVCCSFRVGAHAEVEEVRMKFK